MRKELQDKLYEKYPKIFRQKDLSMMETAMCWGIDCSDGWYSIIDDLCNCIQSHVDQKNYSIEYKRKKGELPPDAPNFPQIEAVQVKEKFGGLRFYTNHYDDFISGAIYMAESVSLRTCEDCGGAGEQNSEGWIVTLCDPCRDKAKIKQKKLLEETLSSLTVKMKDVTVAP